MGYGIEAMKIAQNYITLAVALWVAGYFVKWIWQDWRALMREPLGTMPFSILATLLYLAAVGLWYGTARFFGNPGAWNNVPVVTGLGFLGIFATFSHMAAKWRALGVPVWPRACGWMSVILAAWAGLAWALW